MTSLPPDPDRRASTLALRDRVRAEAGPGPFAPPGAGSIDCRIPLKQLWWATEQALATRGTDAARARFAEVDAAALRAGTVQDGVARGVQVALEEALSLCDPAPSEAEPEAEISDEDLARGRSEVLEGKDLRRRRELLVASGGARIRWSRRGGILFVDRDHDVHAEDCLRFEDRRDLGDLDGFVADPTERPRLFSPAFLKPIRWESHPGWQSLTLEGRLGRRPDGFPCRMVVVGRAGESKVHLSLSIHNDHLNHRLRLRLLSCRNPAAISSAGSPPPTVEIRKSRFHTAVTLVRACGVLHIGDDAVLAPDAQCKGWIHHHFELGGAPWHDASKV